MTRDEAKEKLIFKASQKHAPSTISQYVDEIFDYRKIELDDRDRQIINLQTRLSEANENLLDIFNQSCQASDSEEDGIKYDHQCLSANEDAQAYLVGEGLVKESECLRK